MKAAAGRVARCLRRCDDGVLAALGEASVEVGASIRSAVQDRAGAIAGRFIVSIRPADRERFGETMSPAPCRWIGETTTEPGLRFL